MGYVLSRRNEYAPGEAFNMPPGHGAWTVGGEPCVLVDSAG